MKEILKKIKFNSVGVQVAIITGIFAIIVASIYVVNSRTTIYKQNNTLSDKVTKQNDEILKLEKEILKKNDEIQRLETLLTPFRTIALEKYTGTEEEALQKLKDHINALEKKTIMIENKMLPRTISSLQIQSIGNQLKPIKNIKVKFVIMASDSEIEDLKNQFKQIFAIAEWKVIKVEYAMAIPFKGLTIFTSDRPANDAVKTLYLALKTIGIEPEVTQDESLTKGLISIKIGSK